MGGSPSGGSSGTPGGIRHAAARRLHLRPTLGFVYRLAHRDVKGHGENDLLLCSRTRRTGTALGDSETCLRGETPGGIPFEGCDVIATVPARGHGYELAFLVPPLLWMRRQRRHSSA